MKHFIIVAGLILLLGMAGCGDQKDSHKNNSQPASVASDANTMCPIMGDAIDSTVYTTYKGKKVYFCCPGCIKKFNKNPEKYLASMK